MLIYKGNKKMFMVDVVSGAVAHKIEFQFALHGLSHDNESEFRSWQNSLTRMSDVLDTPDFSDEIQIAIEYQIPQTSKRVDFIIAGENADRCENVVVVELKQWEEAKAVSRAGLVMAFTGGANRVVAHPSYQAYSYAKTIENFNSAVQDEQIVLHPCAYLHNYKPEKFFEISNAHYADIIELAPLFIKREEERFRAFIKRYVTRGPKRDLLYTIDNGKIRPSKALQDALGSMLRGNEEFIMIDEQKVVYETVLKLVENALAKDEKYTIIVEGGPGTGKSVVAIRLLVELVSRCGRNAQYVTKNAAPRNVYFEKLRSEKYKLNYIKNLFKPSGSYVDIPQNTFDCLLVDEAHRLNDKSGLFHNLGENQIKEIINASRVSVFFIDENQVVTTSDIGSVAEIEKWSAECHSHLIHDESTVLSSQFRCNGSDGYIAFLDDLLGIRSTANYDGFDSDYEIRLFDDPCEMRSELFVRNQINNKSRMLAGYCYEWITKNDMFGDKYDIVLPHGFRAKWNFSNTSTWAIDPESFDEVGCIHTSQGLEFDYVGVIIGKDLRYENGHVITEKGSRAKTDKSLAGWKTRGGEQLADRIIRNTYKTLLTRGQKGCFIYCEDASLQEYIRSRLARINH